MLEDINPTAYHEFIIIFLMCLGSFLIGYISSRVYYKKKFKNELNDIIIEKGMQFKKVEAFNSDSTMLSENKIKAVQTRGRRGMVVSDSNKIIDNEKPTLNFESFGVADSSFRDKLTAINGIGPFIEGKLNKIGIYTYEQISKFSDDDIEIVTQLIEFFPGRIKRDDWKGQALRLIKKRKQDTRN
ncbi:hypothetical protein [Leptobacterium sp. I13]|uniref:hypothetical protein n=1 Tax=Leptobacterium meishanense TaxID=3128904 RepID=UPI0030EF2F86